MFKVIRLKSATIRLCINSQIGFDKKENQDAFAFDKKSDSFVVSVCDGLGSAKLSAEGSKYAAETMVNRQLSQNNSPLDFQRDWVNHFPGENQLMYNTTAKFLKIYKKTINYGGIGDGLIAFLKGKKLITQTSHGEFSNQTSSVLDPYYSDKYLNEKLEYRKECTCLICTDGFSEDIEIKDLKELLKTAREALRSNRKAEEFDQAVQTLLANWPNTTNGDDKTVAFVQIRRTRRWAKR